MTQKRAFTLTITNGNRGRIAPANVTSPPEAQNANRFEDRISSRAGLAATYAGLLGVAAVPRDLFDVIGAATQENAAGAEEAAAISLGLHSLGLMAEVSRVDALSADMWPALAFMTSGQVLLVLGQSRGDLVLYDTTCTDNRAHVPIADFKPFFAGMVVRAEAPLTRVAETHKTESKAPHWFWGQFGRFRRQLAEVAFSNCRRGRRHVREAVRRHQGRRVHIPGGGAGELHAVRGGSTLTVFRSRQSLRIGASRGKAQTA